MGAHNTARVLMMMRKDFVKIMENAGIEVSELLRSGELIDHYMQEYSKLSNS